MSRQRGDVHEMRRRLELGLGPLFEPPIEHLVGRSDPRTSRQAADAMKESGALGEHQRWTLTLISMFEGNTVPELARLAAKTITIETDLEVLRQRIGRRVNELEKAGLIHRKGTRDGCSVWWTGKAE